MRGTMTAVLAAVLVLADAGQCGKIKPGYRETLLAFAVEWDDPAAAKEFFAAYRTVLTKKWSRAEFREDSPGRLAGTGDRGGFAVTLQGAVVSSVEGLREGTVN